MTPEEREELLAAHALGTLSAPDAADAEQLIRSDTSAAAQFRAYREIADLIALSVPLRRADPALRERVLAAARRGRRSWRPALSSRHMPVYVLAAALAAVTIWAATLQASLVQLRQETSALSAVVESDAKRLDRLAGAASGVQEARTLSLQLNSALKDEEAVQKVQADPRAVVTILEQTAASHGAGGAYMTSADESASVLVLHSLPTLPLGGAYRVWLEDPLSQLTLAASFVPDSSNGARVALQRDTRLEAVRVYVVATSRADDPAATGPVVLMATLPKRATTK
ncbi:MAG: anti-sigma factor [Dehalococcoidia bacterium]